MVIADNKTAPAAAILQAPTPAHETVELTAFSYDERQVTLPAVADALDGTGCWLLERRSTSFAQVEWRFEAPMSSVMDVYIALVGTGLELNRDGHLSLHGLCTLRSNARACAGGPRVVAFRLQVTFVEEMDVLPLVNGLARA